MNREMAWGWGKLVMRHLRDALGCDIDLTFCQDGTVVGRFQNSCGNTRFRFDPQDGYLHLISTITQEAWRSPADIVKLIVSRLNRRISPPGYFTVEPGWGITYRSSLSMLPIPGEMPFYYYIRLGFRGWKEQYETLLTQIPTDPAACALMEKRTRYLDCMHGGNVYPCGSYHRWLNQSYELLTKGVFW